MRILLWFKVFVTDLPYGEKVVIIPMDTQGASDNESIVRDSATVFTLSTALCFVQIQNFFHYIQEDDLQYLQFSLNMVG
jgi:hypothetical protein